MSWKSVVPSKILHLLTIDHHVIVLGFALIWTLGFEVALSKDGLVNSAEREVVPSRQSRLKEVHG